MVAKVEKRIMVASVGNEKGRGGLKCSFEEWGAVVEDW
jgi:hypothetical protein